MIKLSSNELRKKWISFFESKKHLFVEPASLIPIDDPSLLWINSGVATLKDYFTGKKNPPSNRLVNSQISIRTNDIANVGVTSRHHTIFEMLGNFSIGDYFKNEAIEFGYDFLVNELKIEIDKLYITVYKEDDITYKKWLSLGIKKNHIMLTNKDRNFWDIGQGPCGPCTEIFYDRGTKYDPNNIGVKLFYDDMENDRYVEIWNIVFSEFNNDGSNNYTQLARKNIDTGAGFERLCCISQDAITNFETDLFIDIINKLEANNNIKYDPDAYFKNHVKQNKINMDYRIIVDHIKANLFAISDGERPSNKERGAVLRKLFRRAMISAKNLNLLDNFIEVTVNELVNKMGNFFVRIKGGKELTIKILNEERTLFEKTLESGLNIWNNMINNGIKKMDGQTLFDFVTTYGFPLEVIKQKAIENNIEIDEQEYEELFIKHQEISRASINENVGMSQQSNDLINFTKKSSFIYSKSKIENVKLIGIFDDKFNQVKNISGLCWLVFNKTPFYATSGGQIHDEGNIIINNKTYKIIDVIKIANGQHLHLIDTKKDKINYVNDCITLKIDTKFRNDVSRNHTVEHLLEMVLNKNIDSSIKQEGAFKTNKYFTFDFNLNRKLTNNELELVEKKVNDIIMQKHKLLTKKFYYKDIENEGFVGHFKDVYKKIKDKIRVVFIGDINKEICGGTHVKNTNNIEKFKIINYEHKSSNSWRIRGITSNKSIDEYIISEIDNIQLKINNLIGKLKNANINNNEINNIINTINYTYTNENYIKLKEIVNNIEPKINELIINQNKDNTKQEINNIINLKFMSSQSNNIRYAIVNNYSNKNITSGLNTLIASEPICFAIINKLDNKFQYILISHKTSNINCQELIKEINSICSGSGGGNINYAQGGSNIGDKINEVINLLIKK